MWLELRSPRALCIKFSNSDRWKDRKNPDFNDDNVSQVLECICLPESETSNSSNGFGDRCPCKLSRVETQGQIYERKQTGPTYRPNFRI